MCCHVVDWRDCRCIPPGPGSLYDKDQAASVCCCSCAITVDTLDDLAARIAWYRTYVSGVRVVSRRLINQLWITTVGGASGALWGLYSLNPLNVGMVGSPTSSFVLEEVLLYDLMSTMCRGLASLGHSVLRPSVARLLSKATACMGMHS